MNQERQEPSKDPERNGQEPESAEASAGTAEREAPEAAEAAQTDAEAGAEETFTFTRAQVEAMELAAQQLEQVKDQFVRLTAEYENYRKRTAREKENLWQDAKADTVKAFLGVYDDLERASGAEGGEDSPHKKGLEMIFQKYKDVLKTLGVTEIEAQGKPFDPEKHNAVLHVEDEQLGENTVAQVFQAGFQLGDKVIRHATVQVAN